MYQHFWLLEKERLEQFYKIARKNLMDRAGVKTPHNILWAIIDKIDNLKKADNNGDSIKLYAAALTETLQLLNQNITPEQYISNSHKMVSQSVDNSRTLWAVGLEIACVGAILTIFLTPQVTIPIMLVGLAIFALGAALHMYFSNSKHYLEQSAVEKSLEQSMIEFANQQPSQAHKSFENISSDYATPGASI